MYKPGDDDDDPERLRRARIQAARLRLFIRALLDAMRKAEQREIVDWETGEVMRPRWPISQRVSILVEHSAGCDSHWHTAGEGFTCTCSPEISVKVRS